MSYLIFFCKPKKTIGPNSYNELASRYLSVEERAKAERIADVNRRHSVIQSHALKRFVLSQQLAVPPHELEFQEGLYGKPYLSNPALNTLFFNISYSSGRTALIVSRLGEVGIDIESRERPVDFEAIEKIVFSQEEINGETPATLKERRDLFYKIWTVKEAFLKATGTGLSIEPTAITVEEREGKVQIKTNAVPNASNFSIYSFNVDSYAVACSVFGPITSPAHIYNYEFNGQDFELIE